MTGAAPAPHVWLWAALALGLLLLSAALRWRTSITALWRTHQETREAENERDAAAAKAERDRLSNGLDLDALEVSDIMIHRTAMRALNAGDPPEEIVKAVLESPYTRMPLWAGSVDNIVGVVHAKDLLRALTEPGIEAKTLDITKVAQ
jgi:Mg2+/Co2+ transporter CorB